MKQQIGWNGRLAALLLGTAMVVSGCKSAPAPVAGVRNSDGSITNADGSITYPAGTAPAAATTGPKVNPDGSTTNPDGSVTYPAGSRRAERENRQPTATSSAPQQAAAPVERTQPQAPPPPPEHEARVIPTDTPVHVTITETLSASKNDVGDSFTGSLNAPILFKGETAFKVGTPVTGSVIASKKKGRFKGAGDLGIEITSIGGQRVSTTEYEAIAKGSGKRTGGFIGGGAGLGALIGGIAGGGKGALIGGLAGAGAGTAGAAYTGSKDVVIHSETPVTFRLTAPVTLR